jgi:hypothetical protein
LDGVKKCVGGSELAYFTASDTIHCNEVPLRQIEYYLVSRYIPKFQDGRFRRDEIGAV